jgi:hypothetical protein
MKMWYACHGVAGAEVVFDTGAASLYVRLTREPSTHGQGLLYTGGEFRRLT